MKRLSLRAVAAPAEISPTYLQKLERGEVQDPSPNILHRLSEQLGLEYSDLMQKAGYVVPATSKRRSAALRGSRAVSHALSAEPLTAEEEEALAHYLGYLRSQKGGPKSGA
jgi:transcriptional regulator with XRE-family HTH domain